MGGELRDCGCFLGPYSEADPTLVAIRCEQHVNQPVPDGYMSMTRKQALMSLAVRVRAMAVPRGGKRRRGRGRR